MRLIPLPRPLAYVLVLVLVLAACSSSSTSPSADAPDAASDAGIAADAGPPSDAAVDAGLTGQCASSFDGALTPGFGRLDGVVYAIQKPTDQACALPNSSHVIVQVLTGGDVYRMVVNVASDQGGADLRVREADLPHALPAPPFAEGWHTDAPLDYVTTLGAHDDGDGGASPAFTPLDEDPLVERVAALVHVGDPVSVYATNGASEPESAHLVHRNATNQDGAIVVAPTSATPTFLLFHFIEQTF